MKENRWKKREENRQWQYDTTSASKQSSSKAEQCGGEEQPALQPFEKRCLVKASINRPLCNLNK